jgi:succinoglycan biosynthesis transport protein ExoP
MGIIQFLRILWARRLMIAACTLFTFLGGFVVTLVVQPRYEASSRVMLGVLKPDVVTGQANTQYFDAYVQTQSQLIKDYRVAGPVVDSLGWLSDPGKIAQYQARPQTDTRDFRRWLAQQVSDRTTAKLVSGTIFEISFTSPSPTEAKVGAEVLRQAYMDYTLASRRQEASRNAQWFVEQADKARKLAEAAEITKATFERENGILMQGDEGGDPRDIDSARLAALVSQASVVPQRQAVAVSSDASLQLAQVDAEISQNSDKLGPNHPQMQQLRARRALIATVIAQQQAQARQMESAGSNLAAVNQALNAQKSLVLSQRDKVERLRQLQSEVQLRREQYKKTAARAAELNLEAGIADNGMTMLGVVVTPSKPAFPNKPLVIIGSFVLGGGLGLVLAVLIELLNRRVRGVEDLDLDEALHCLAVISSPLQKKSIWGRSRAAGPPKFAGETGQG